ncbi:citrate synthase [Paraburkholderia sp. BL23I1N1]|uniref:citrate/2-methylcitrate synthase n=1 Tax=Paraburkholderia sp. BL23I1N1 TaxID=1938802 RepID=UPI000E71EB6A|nr:citrate/2-methylcitrate synthase [Paraburkholderia sp. BL23I1N1]RKE38558.1 citrate synthase [Paraburkholderia sp. BL23I1N1]
MAALGVKAQTLYAYVSRGLIRTVNPDKRKASLYYREDIEALQMRGRSRRALDYASQRALRTGGGAVMQSAITDLTPEGPRYRGQSAAQLARSGRSFEQCVELLWSGLLPQIPPQWAPPQVDPRFLEFARLLCPIAAINNPRRLFSLLVEARAASLGYDPEMAAGAPTLAARSVVQTMVGTTGMLRDRPAYCAMKTGESIAQWVVRALGGAKGEEATRAVDAALVLCADHELAPSTFVARIAASAGADIHSCVSAALGSFEGIQTGMGCDIAEDLLRRATSPKEYLARMRRAAKNKEPMAGFNHAVYPSGDPRGEFLLQLCEEVRKADPEAVRALRCVRAAQDELGATPSLGIGLSVLSITLGHPPRSPGAIMALARSAGWIAHAYEQRMAGFLVRPHAKYVGL